jgi:hypothetical protein
LDSAALFWLARRVVSVGKASAVRAVAVLAASLAVLGVAAVLQTPLSRLAYAVVGSVAFIIVAWRWILTADDRANLLSRQA